MHRTLVLLLAALLVVPAAAAAKPNKKVCDDTAAGYAHCNARVITDAKGDPAATETPSGYGPADLQSRLRLPERIAGGRQDLRDRRRLRRSERRGRPERLPRAVRLPACTTANGCFRKVNQNGGTPLPRANGGWAQEISLDLDMASAMCPNCKILLVEANSNAFTDLARGGGHGRHPRRRT